MQIYSIGVQQSHPYNTNFKAKTVELKQAQVIIDDVTTTLVTKGKSLNIKEMVAKYRQISELMNDFKDDVIVHYCQSLLNLMKTLSGGNVLWVPLKENLDKVCQNCDADGFNKIVSDPQNTEIMSTRKEDILTAYDNILNKAYETADFQAFNAIATNTDNIDKNSLSKIYIKIYNKALKLRGTQTTSKEFNDAEEKIMQLINKLTDYKAGKSILKKLMPDMDQLTDEQKIALIAMIEGQGLDRRGDKYTLPNILSKYENELKKNPELFSGVLSACINSMRKGGNPLMYKETLAKYKNELKKNPELFNGVLSAYINSICKGGNSQIYKEALAEYKEELKENPAILDNATDYLNYGSWIETKWVWTGPESWDREDGHYGPTPKSTTAILNLYDAFKEQCIKEDLQCAINNGDMKTIKKIIDKNGSSLDFDSLYACYKATVNNTESKISEKVNKLTKGKATATYFKEQLNNAIANKDYSTCLELCLGNTDTIKKDKELCNIVRSMIADIKNNSGDTNIDKNNFEKLLISLI